MCGGLSHRQTERQFNVRQSIDYRGMSVIEKQHNINSHYGGASRERERWGKGEGCGRKEGGPQQRKKFHVK